jgi:hypothetical protein
MGAQMIRKPDYLVELHAYLSTCRERPYQEGVHDCAQFAFGAIKAQTGVDLLAEFPVYSSKSEGLNLLRDAGYGDLVSFATTHLREVPVSLAGLGALVFVDEGDLIPAVLMGSQIWCVSEVGCGHLPRHRARLAFEIGGL